VRSSMDKRFGSSEIAGGSTNQSLRPTIHPHSDDFTTLQNYVFLYILQARRACRRVAVWETSAGQRFTSTLFSQSTKCRPHVDLMSTSCRPHVDLMSTSCRPHVDLHVDGMSPSCRLHIGLMSFWHDHIMLALADIRATTRVQSNRPTS
jgi:hypothetical protein